MQNLTNEEQVVVIQARTVLTLAEKVTVDVLGGGLGPSLAQFRGDALLGRGAPQGLGWELAVGGQGPLSLAALEAWAHTWVRQHPPCMSPQGQLCPDFPRGQSHGGSVREIQRVSPRWSHQAQALPRQA